MVARNFPVLLDRPEVLRRTGMTGADLSGALLLGTFPDPINLGPLMRRRWLEHEVDGWLADQRLAAGQPDLLSRAQVLECCALSDSTLATYLRQRAFPEPLRIGRMVKGWRERDVAQWIGAKAAESRHGRR